MFSNKVRSINESPIRKFALNSKKACELGKNVIPLNIGQPDLLTPKEFLESIKNINEDTVIAYTPSNGIDELLVAFSGYFKSFDINYEPDDILITNGGSEALSFTFATLCDPGEEVLVIEPYYANYNTIAKTNSVNIKAISTDYENDFRYPSYEDMKAKVSDKTKAILVTNPSNPTGIVLNEEEIMRVVKLAIEFNLFIISDEVYREFIYDDAKFISFTNYPEIIDRLVIIDSVSKRFSGCGIRIGCVASKNKEFIAQVLKLCQARLSVPLLEQIGAVGLFNANRNCINDAVEKYKIRRDVCFNEIKKMEDVVCKVPQGAFYFILSLPIKSSEDFTGWLLSEFDIDNETIMLCPAGDFYESSSKGKNEIRISYCISEDKLVRAMRILSEGLKEYKRQGRDI